MNPLDDDLRARFEQLRDDDRATVPAFQPMWERAKAAASASRRRRLLPAGIAAAAAVVVAAGLLIHKTNDPEGFHSTATISSWTSPTASLLNALGRDLFAPPPLLSSTLDSVIQVPVTLKGASR